MRQSPSNINHKKVQVIPADKKLGFPPAALNARRRAVGYWAFVGVGW